MNDLHIADVSVVDVATGAVRRSQSVRVADGVIAEVGSDALPQSASSGRPSTAAAAICVRG